jgi:hypothetical protein
MMTSLFHSTGIHILIAVPINNQYDKRYY